MENWSIRSISNASVGIPWMGSGAAREATIMLVREVSVRVYIAFIGSVVLVFGNKNVNLRGGLLFVEYCQKISRRDTSNKHSLKLCASVVHVFLDGCSKWYVSVVFLAGQVLGIW
jgi:hypothetical protein